MTSPIQLRQTLREWMDVFMHRSMQSWTHFAKSTGLSMPQFSILMQLHHKGPFGMSHISERFDITAAAASQLAEKLVQGGFIERTEDPNDRRAKLIQLTPKGIDLMEEGMKERYRWMDEVTSKLTADEKGKVTEALSILTEAAKKLDDSK